MLSSDALVTARQALQSADVPLILGVSRYLRISCLRLNSSSVRYSSLMNALFTQNPDWLDTVSVTPAGYLRSSDRAIEKLLRPVTALHQSSQMMELPLAA